MFNIFTSLGAKTNFERLRLNLTTKTLDAQDEQQMNGIYQYIQCEEMIKIFDGGDEETRSHIAYATIINKILHSNSKNSWIYLLKNLIIIDRVASEKVFNSEFATENLQTVEMYKEDYTKYYYFNSERVLKCYWSLIKYECKNMAQGNHIFYYRRSQRENFISSLKVGEILKQMVSIESYFALVFEIIDILSQNPNLQQQKINDQSYEKRMQLLCSPLIGQLYLRLFQKLMTYYASELICGNGILKLMMSSNSFSQISGEQLQIYRKAVLKFKQNSDNYVRFIEMHKQIKGFSELNYKELNPFQNQDVIKIVDQFIKEKKSIDQQRPIQKLLLTNSIPLTVNITPDSHINVLAPRIKFVKQEIQKQTKNPFFSWVNEYSSQFPQPEVMTIDLIQLLKKEEEEKKSGVPLVYNVLRESCLLSPRNVTNIAQQLNDEQQSSRKITYCPRKNSNQVKVNFQNIYSSDENNWVDS